METDLPDWKAITDDAFDRLVATLNKHDNTLSKDHASALRVLLDAFSRMASGDLSGRYAFGLSCGLGKTSAVEAWLSALASNPNVLAQVGVGVAATKVEELCRMKRALIAAGVHEELIALVHSYKHDPEGVKQGKPGVASEPSTPNPETRPIALVTHSRINLGADGLDTYQKFAGKPRLLIWDEALIVSSARSLDIVSLREAVGGFIPPGPPIEGRAEAGEWLTSSLGMILAELDRLADPLAQTRTLQLPQRSAEALEHYRSQIAECDKSQFDPALILLDFATERLRVSRAGQGQGLLTYSLRVPKSLENIVVLDASYPIRELEKLDQTIVDGETLPLASDCSVSFASIKDHSNVKVLQWVRAGGRASMRAAFKRNRKNRDVTQAIVEAVKGVPSEEAVLFFVYKPRIKEEPDYEKILRGDLKAAGIDVDATVEVQIDGKTETRPRFNFSTWGNETSSNEWAFIPNFFAVGIYRRRDQDIAACSLGQRASLLAPLTSSHVREVQRSEVANAVYQAASRCAMRRVHNGKALKTTTWIIDFDPELSVELEKVLQGASFEAWLPEQAIRIHKTKKWTDRIGRYLARPDVPDKLSVTALKRELKRSDETAVSPDTFTRALGKALKRLPGWTKDGRSLHRLTGGL